MHLKDLFSLTSNVYMYFTLVSSYIYIHIYVSVILVGVNYISLCRKNMQKTAACDIAYNRHVNLIFESFMVLLGNQTLSRTAPLMAI